MTPVVKVWLLVVFGVAMNGNYNRESSRPMIVIDNLVSREQCVALGKRLAAKTYKGTYDCSGLNKVR